MQAAVVAHTSSTLAYHAAQECLPRQHKLIYGESVSLKRNDNTRQAEEVLMQAPSNQTCPAERTLDAALAGIVQQIPGLASDSKVETKLMHLLDKGVMMTPAETRAVMIKFLRQYANPLPPKQSVAPKVLVEAVKQSGPVRLNAATWSFGLKKELPNNLSHGRCRGTTLKNGTRTAVGSISWEDRGCIFYDTILSRQWLCECVMQAESESAIYWCWEFCKAFVLRATQLGPNTTLSQMEQQTTVIKVWFSNQLTHGKITLVEFWEELELSWRALLQTWQKNQYHSVSGASRENHGLENVQDSYNEGKGMELLRQAIEQWASHPHVVKYIVGEQCTNAEKGKKQTGKRKASALNGFPPSHSHFPDAAASISQPDGQPDSSTVPSSAESDPNAEVNAAPLAACSTSQQGSTKQVPFVEVSVNGQVYSMHPMDAVQCRAAAVPHQIPGVPMTVHDLQQSSDVTASATVISDAQFLDFLTDLDQWDSVNTGSLRLNVRLANMADPAQQSKAVHQLLTSIIIKCGMDCAFAMTVKVPGSTLSCTKSAGNSPVEIKEASGLQPVISAVYFSHTEPDHMILEGRLSEDCTLWSFCDSARAVTYLEVVKTAAKNVVPEGAIKKEDVKTAVKDEAAETASIGLSNASPGTRGAGSIRSDGEEEEAEAVWLRTRLQLKRANEGLLAGLKQSKRAKRGQTGVLQQMPSLQQIVSLLLSVQQSAQESNAAACHGKITVQMPGSVLDSSSFWLQAQCGNCISEPFGMPRYAVTVKEQSMSRFQDHWRRYMYSPDTLRRVQWTDDPIVARAQLSSPSHSSELGPVDTQTSDVDKKHNDGHDGTSDLGLLHAYKMMNSKVDKQLARQARQSYKSDGSQHAPSNLMMARDSEGVSCLHALAQSSGWNITPLLVNLAGEGLMHLRTRWGLHAMHYAAGNLVEGCKILTQMTEFCRKYFNQDVDGFLDCKDARGCTPLHWAAKVGNAKAIKWLLGSGADPNAQDHAQASPLHYAVVSPTACRLYCIEAMLAVSSPTQADVSAKDINSQTPLHWLAGACHLRAHLDAMKLLVIHGADVCATDNLGNSPLHIAAASSSLPATVSQLLAYGADPQAVNVYCDTALHTAAGFGNSVLLEGLTKELQKKGPLAAAVSRTNRAGYTPLQLAVVVGWSQAAVRCLLQLELEQHQEKSSSQLLELLVAQGWRSELGPPLVRQALADGVSLPALWRSLQLLSKQRIKEVHDLTGEPVQSASSFRSQLHVRFSNTVSRPNRLLRVRLVLRLFRIASSAGGWEKAVPSAVDFVVAGRPAGLNPRPQSSFISSESQTVLGVFNRFYDLPGYMPSYNQPVNAVDEVLSGLLDACTSHSDCFLGSLAMFHGPFTGHYWLIDGHQKLTTLQLILAFGMHWANSQGPSQAALFDALRSGLWAEKAEEAPSRWRLQSRQDDQKFLCANVLQSFLPVKYMWQADGGPTAGGNVSDHSADFQGSWADQSQGLSNAAWWHVYANARRVREVLTDEQQMHQLDLAAFFRHMCQHCHMTCTISRDESSAFCVLGSLRLELPVMDRVKIGMLQLLRLADQKAFAERWNSWETDLGASLFEELFTHCRQTLRPADTKSQLSLLEYYLSLKTGTQVGSNASHKAAAVKSCLTQVFQCAAILHQVTSYGFAASITAVAQPSIKQEGRLSKKSSEGLSQADTVTDMDTEMQKLPVLDTPSVVDEQPGKAAAGVTGMEETGCSDKEEAKGHQSTEVETLQSLDALCRFLMLMPDREWIGLALHFCHLEQDSTQRLAFFGCLEALQVFFWLTEATADSKESRWSCIREKLNHEVCQSQDQMQQSQQQQQQQQQEPGRTPIQGLIVQAGLGKQPAGAGPSMPTPAHLGLQAAKLTDTEKTRFKAELSRFELLRQGNVDLVKYLLLRAEGDLSWANISWSQLQVDQILPDQPYTRSSGTLWQHAVLDSPSPTDPECARQHWTALQMQSARRSIGNMLLLQAATSFTERQRKQDFSNKKKDYVCKYNCELFPMSAAIIVEPYFSCKYEYAARQQAYIMRLCQIYGL